MLLLALAADAAGLGILADPAGRLLSVYSSTVVLGLTPLALPLAAALGADLVGPSQHGQVMAALAAVAGLGHAAGILVFTGLYNFLVEDARLHLASVWLIAALLR